VMIDVEFRKVSKSYGAVSAVRSIDLEVPSGSFLALLGPSGCGKTTSLRMIAGFEQPSLGEVLIRGESMAGVPAYNRPVNMVFQQYALFPHLNVASNVAYGLQQVRPKLGKREIDRRVQEALEKVHLDGYSNRRTVELSGGQQQRVALARAIVNKPSVLLLDEPLAALDKKLRGAMQIELQSLQRDLGITFVLVTHDQEEALSMSDMVCVMNGGEIVQIGSPKDVYDEPADLFVADFVGKANMLRADVMEIDGATVQVRLANGVVVVAHSTARQRNAIQRGAPVTVPVRPEAMQIARASTAGAAPPQAIRGTVTNRIFLGSTVEYAIDVPGVGNLLATTEHQARVFSDLIDPGEDVCITFSPEAALVFPAKPGKQPTMPQQP
jgi:spermidine/putrescine transport system ATP-binding protein